MTKEEVLQGALALNGTDQPYTVTVEENKIIMRARYHASLTHTRTEKFRCVAYLNDDHTYVETHSGYKMGGKVVHKSVTFTFGGKDEGVAVEKDPFNSEDLKKY